MTHRFHSLKNPNYMYSVGEDLWDSAYRTNPEEYLANNVGMFDTYGDGDVQHSSCWLAGKEYFSDFCLCYAQHILTQGIGWRQCYIELRGISRKDAEFFASVKFDDREVGGKDRYWSPSLKKVTGSASKRYDTRWEKVPPWANGSADSIYKLFTSMEHCYGLLDRYTVWDDLIDYGLSTDSLYQVNKRFGLDDWANSEFNCLRNALRSAVHRWQSERGIESCISNFNRNKEQEAEQQKKSQEPELQPASA